MRTQSGLSVHQSSVLVVCGFLLYQNLLSFSKNVEHLFFFFFLFFSKPNLSAWLFPHLRSIRPQGKEERVGRWGKNHANKLGFEKKRKKGVPRFLKRIINVGLTIDVRCTMYPFIHSSTKKTIEKQNNGNTTHKQEKTAKGYFN